MKRSIPVPFELDRVYWDGLKEGRLLIQQSAANGRFQYYPRAHDLASEDGIPTFVEASGRGVIESFTVIARSFYDDIEAPYVLALVRLDEDVLVTTNIVDSDIEALKIGDRVEAVFKPINDDITLAFFKAGA